MVMTEMEVIAKKFDRFGWERDRGTATHDRLLEDWAEALCDYPLDEVRAACRAVVLENPRTMPNEGHVKAQIIKARAAAVRRHKANLPAPVPEPVNDNPERAARAKAILAEVMRDKA